MLQNYPPVKVDRFCLDIWRGNVVDGCLLGDNIVEIFLCCSPLDAEVIAQMFELLVFQELLYDVRPLVLKNLVVVSALPLSLHTIDQFPETFGCEIVDLLS